MKLEQYHTKEELREVKYHKNVYFYRVIDSDKRGYNRAIEVSIQRKDYSFVTLGWGHVSTASYKGVRPTANNVISIIMGHKMSDGCELLSNKIKVIEY